MKKKHFTAGGLTIDYKELGTISIEEFRDAVIADIEALKDIYNIRFVKGPRMRMYPTNEYGEPVKLVRPTGGTIDFMDTHHYRPACKDYEL